MSKLDITKVLYELCEELNLNEKEEKEISIYIDDLTKEFKFLQENINKNNVVNLFKKVPLLKGNQNDNKKNS